MTERGGDASWPSGFGDYFATNPRQNAQPDQSTQPGQSFAPPQQPGVAEEAQFAPPSGPRPAPPQFGRPLIPPPGYGGYGGYVSPPQQVGYGTPPPHIGYRQPSQYPPSTGRPAGLRLWAPLLTALALILAVGAVVLHKNDGHVARLASSDGMFDLVTKAPPEHAVLNPTRILPAPAPQPGSGGYTVLHQNGGLPVAWDPCQPIHIVVRPNNEIPGGEQFLNQALAEVSKDTGLYFVDDGATTENPSPSRDSYQPKRYGQNWSPVLIAWSTPQEFPDLAGNVVGLASPVAVGGKDARIVSGQVVFDAPDLARIEGYPNGSTYVYDVLLHELGHLVGLGHIADPEAIMNPIEIHALPGYGPGDLRGLAALGSGKCFDKA